MGGALVCMMEVCINRNVWSVPRVVSWCDAESIATWLSVLVKRGQEIVKVVKCSWEDTFGSLLVSLI